MFFLPRKEDRQATLVFYDTSFDFHLQFLTRRDHFQRVQYQLGDPHYLRGMDDEPSTFVDR